MIQTLLTAIADLLQTELEARLPRSKSHFAMMPIAEPTVRPTIALYPGTWLINQTAREVNINEPRPQDLRQVIALNPHRKTPYPLEKPPLKGTLRAVLMIKDRQKPLQEGTDFAIDYAKATLAFIANLDISNAKQVILDYAFPGIFTVREFQQDFWIEIYDQDFAQLEQWSSLITGILINSHDALIEQYNTPIAPQAKTEYQSEQFVITHTLSQFRLLEGTYMPVKTGVALQIKIGVVGQLKMTKAIAEGVIPIQKVTITGTAADQTIHTTAPSAEPA